jgi:hypothetical protein
MGFPNRFEFLYIHYFIGQPLRGFTMQPIIAMGFAHGYAMVTTPWLNNTQLFAHFILQTKLFSFHFYNLFSAYN